MTLQSSDELIKHRNQKLCWLNYSSGCLLIKFQSSIERQRRKTSSASTKDSELMAEVTVNPSCVRKAESSKRNDQLIVVFPSFSSPPASSSPLMACFKRQAPNEYQNCNRLLYLFHVSCAIRHQLRRTCYRVRASSWLNYAIIFPLRIV